MLPDEDALTTVIATESPRASAIHLSVQRDSLAPGIGTPPPTRLCCLERNEDIQHWQRASDLYLTAPG